MIEATIFLVIEVENDERTGERKLILVIRSKSGIIKAIVYGKSIDFMCKLAKVSSTSELVGNDVMLDVDANYSCIYIIVNKTGRMAKVVAVPCEISLIKTFKKH